eukprot:Hpha_TRINITY_DN17293_c0_g1::TRINITY_DN17293_c0_g1_i1::g.17935::m.17935
MLRVMSLFVPHIALLSLPLVGWTKNNSESEVNESNGYIGTGPDLNEEARNNILRYMYVGPKQYKVHLVDTRLQLYGPTHDIAMAMKLWPMFHGVFLLGGDDSFPAWWKFTNYSKDKVWRQRPIFLWPRSVARFPKPKNKKRGGNQGVGGRVNDYRTMRRVLAEIGHDFNRSDEQKVTAFQTASGSTLYYVPMKHREKVLNYDPIFLKHRIYLEVAVPMFLATVADDTQILFGHDILTNLHTRYRYTEQFRPHDKDYLHPVRAPNELFTRLAELARRVPLPQEWKVDDFGFWDECFTCYKYGDMVRKGSHHSCTLGCAEGAGPVRGKDPYHGRLVEVGNGTSMLPGEFGEEGFWGLVFLRKIMSKMVAINNSRNWPPPLPPP